jgi:hypothetical protein
MKRFLIGGLFVAMVAAGNAQTYYARGTFNGYGLTNPLTSLGGGLYETVITGLTPGVNYDFKVADSAWTNGTISPSGDNIKTQSDASGNLKITLNTNAPDPLMSPNTTFRAGFDNNNSMNFEVMGNFPGGDNFGTPLALTYDATTKKYNSAILPLSQFTIGQNYEFKIRKVGDWGVAYGNGLGNLDGNVQFTPQANWGFVTFVFDPTRGQLGAVPEPATMAALGLGILGLARRRRIK